MSRHTRQTLRWVQRNLTAVLQHRTASHQPHLDQTEADTRQLHISHTWTRQKPRSDTTIDVITDINNSNLSRWQTFQPNAIKRLSYSWGTTLHWRLNKRIICSWTNASFLKYSTLQSIVTLKTGLGSFKVITLSLAKKCYTDNNEIHSSLYISATEMLCPTIMHKQQTTGEVQKWVQNVSKSQISLKWTVISRNTQSFVYLLAEVMASTNCRRDNVPLPLRSCCRNRSAARRRLALSQSAHRLRHSLKSKLLHTFFYRVKDIHHWCEVIQKLRLGIISHKKLGKLYSMKKTSLLLTSVTNKLEIKIRCWNNTISLKKINKLLNLFIVVTFAPLKMFNSSHMV